MSTVLADRRLLVLTLVLVACGGDTSGGDGGKTGSDGTTGASATTDDATSSSSVGPSSSDTASETSATSGDATGSTTAPLPPCNPVEFCVAPTHEGVCRNDFVRADGMLIHYWSNLPMEPATGEGGCHAEIDRAVVVQHGNSRNPWSYFAYMLAATMIAGVDSHTLVVAPWFPAAEDGVAADVHVWDPGGSGWKSGDDSLTAPPVSSFAVIDEIVLELVDSGSYPALEEIIVTGHSAGGQLAQRYAVASNIDAATGTVAMRFVVANPSSYLYLDGYRWDGAGAPPGLSFDLPSGTACDAYYDDFKYGLSNLPAGHYVTAHAGGIPDGYLARDVTYLLGEADTQVDSDLDTTCPAQLQGAHRFERGLVFAAYLDARFPAQTHGLATVPGVDHSASDMYTSPVGVATLFGP